MRRNDEALAATGRAPPPVAPAPSPCVGCPNEMRCKRDRLACERFALYQRVGGSPARWSLAPRFPSVVIFDRLHAPIKVKAPAPSRRPPVDAPTEEPEEEEVAGIDLSAGLWD